MKINLFVVVVTVITLTVLGTAGFFIYETLTKSEIQKEESPATIGDENPSTGGEEEPKNPPVGGEEVLNGTRLIKDDFEITLPSGWQEAINPPEGVLAMAFDTKEDISGGNFQKLDFQTNLSIKSDDMKKYANIDDLGAYLESIKTSLIQAVPGINFTKEEQKTINGNQAILIECESKQEEVDFKTLLVFVEGNDKVVYAISFNAFQSSWASYRDAFYQISESFKLKYQLEF